MPQDHRAQGLSPTASALLFLWLIALRLAFQVHVPPLPDEAYYWLWGQRPALSYYDHPPLQAWLLGLSGWIFGWNLFALRAPTLLTSAALAAILVHWSGKAGKRDIVTTLLIFFASPLIFIFTTMVFPDHVMLVFLLLAAGLFRDVMAAARENRVDAKKLYAGGVALGLAGLSKYNAVFLGLAFASVVLALKPYRMLLKSPHLYGAAMIAIALQAPVMAWNAQNGFASFQYNLSDRLSGPRALSRSLAALFALFGGSLGLLSPFLIPGLIRILRGKAGDDPLALLVRALLIVAGLTLGALCFKGEVHYYWFDVALAPAFFLLPFVIGRQWLRAHVAFGAVAIAAFVFNYAVIPFAALVHARDRESALLYGWPEIASFVKEAQARTGVQTIVTTQYRTAAQLAFALKTTAVTALNWQRGEFDIWRQEDMKPGQSALVLADDWEALSPAQTIHFDQVEPAGEFSVTRFGYPLKTYKLYYAQGYRP